MDDLTDDFTDAEFTVRNKTTLKLSLYMIVFATITCELTQDS